MESEIIIDRVLFNVNFSDGAQTYGIGSGTDLYKRVISPNSSGETLLTLELTHEKAARALSLANKFKQTFQCTLNCTMFAEGFKNPYTQFLYTKIPIDEWVGALAWLQKQL